MIRKCYLPKTLVFKEIVMLSYAIKYLTDFYMCFMNVRKKCAL